jgi:protein involved in polysaccharide export with SLBB domain
MASRTCASGASPGSSSNAASKSGKTAKDGDEIWVKAGDEVTIKLAGVPANGDEVLQTSIQNGTTVLGTGRLNCDYTFNGASSPAAAGKYVFDAHVTTRLFSSQSPKKSGSLTINVITAPIGQLTATRASDGMTVGSGEHLKVQLGDQVTVSFAGKVGLGDYLLANHIDLNGTLFADGLGITDVGGSFSISRPFNQPTSPSIIGTYTFTGMVGTSLYTGGVPVSLDTVIVDVEKPAYKVKVTADVSPSAGAASIWFSPGSATRAFTLR